MLPPVLPSTGSPSSAKRNVTFNIYEEVHGEGGKEVKLIEPKGNELCIGHYYYYLWAIIITFSNIQTNYNRICYLKIV